MYLAEEEVVAGLCKGTNFPASRKILPGSVVMVLLIFLSCFYCFDNVVESHKNQYHFAAGSALAVHNRTEPSYKRLKLSLYTCRFVGI